MAGNIKTLLIYGALAGAALSSLFYGGFLQEFSPDDLPEQAATAGVKLPLADPWIEISIQHMTLTLFDGETAVKRYDIGFGKGPVGRRLKGEASTPIGVYEIVKKHKRNDILSRGSRFLQFDYPNEDDAQRAYAAGMIDHADLSRILAAHLQGESPPYDTPLGGPIGIQGNYFFFMDRRFTDGSVALSNSDINELFEHVGVGVKVEIQAE